MKHLIPGFVGLALIATLIASCGEQKDIGGVNRAVSVKAEIVHPQNVQVTGTYTGSLDGEKQAVLYAKISEAVQKVNVDEGQMVKANTTLITLDRTGPSSNYQQAKSLYDNAEKNYNKMAFLYKQGAVSESQYDAAQTDYEVKKAAFEAASQLVEIESPIDGMVTSVDVSAGDYVQIGQRLATVATTRKLRIRFGVNSSDMNYFTEGGKVTVSSEVLPYTATGTITSVPTSANPTTRAFYVEATIDNSAGHFKPGMFVRIEYIKEDLKNVFVVPQNAVLVLDNTNTVFVVKNDSASQRTVVLGPTVGGNVVIDSGLVAGDTLVTLGQDYLDQGFAVRITSLSEGNK
ncbi:MAG: efflux RND transporter periplasmic adaptor subunit [Candidatus Zixiibacteriota bacterium]|jgi:RND family efflux transporter MFP subunit